MVGEVVLQTILAPQYIPVLFDNMQNAEATERDIEIRLSQTNGDKHM